MADATCSIDGCETAAHSRGWCGAHYLRWWKYDDPLAPDRRPKPQDRGSCVVEGCGKPTYVISQRLCNAHYQKRQKYGDATVDHRPAPRDPSAICSIGGCGKRAVNSRGWCNGHYLRWLKNGDPTTTLRPQWVPGATEKECRKCNVVKPLDAFGQQSRGLGGRRATCNECCAAAQSARYRENPERYRAIRLAWHHRHPDRSAALRRKQNLRKYGLTPDGFDAMLVAQNGRCAACGDDEPRGPNWAVDHCHDTGLVRAILCNTCNGALGMLAESPERIKALLAYCESVVLPIKGEAAS